MPANRLTLSNKVHIVPGMNKLSVAQRAQILAMLCEGASMRSVSRLADVSINTVIEAPRGRRPFLRRLPRRQGPQREGEARRGR